MRRGFSILEFLVVCGLILAASTVLLPRALAPRRAVNEEQAVGYLAMIAAAERAWLAETGEFAPLHRLSEEPPAGNDPLGSFTTRTPLLAPGFIVDTAGVAHRGGFRFRLALGAGGAAEGCWAWPNLRGFSGQEVYWADFDAREIRRMRAAVERDGPPPEPPAAADLESAVLLRF